VVEHLPSNPKAPSSNPSTIWEENKNSSTPLKTMSYLIKYHSTENTQDLSHIRHCDLIPTMLDKGSLIFSNTWSFDLKVPAKLPLDIGMHIFPLVPLPQFLGFRNWTYFHMYSCSGNKQGKMEATLLVSNLGSAIC
jgi:hypothetical protein